MNEKKRGFVIFGKVIEKESERGIPNLTVKAIDNDLFFNDLLGAVSTDEDGHFEIRYDNEDFQELFFDKKPDIYLNIKDINGEVIYTTEDNVRFESGKTEKFIVKISKKLLNKEAKMKWNIKKSDKLKLQIARDEKLMRKLSEATDGVLKQYGVQLNDMSYVFEPRVFAMDPNEAPEVMIRSREAMMKAIINDLYNEGLTADSYLNKYGLFIAACLPQCGPYDPFNLEMLEKYRIPKDLSETTYQSVNITNSIDLIKEIIINKNLLTELSKSIFNILAEHGISFKENEGCVFTPVVFDSPIHAQKVAIAKRVEQINGFGPQVFVNPSQDTDYALQVKPYPGLIETQWGLMPGVIVDKWWWVGIPAPELLYALDVMKK